MKEIQGKSILVRVSMSFELATFRVIGSPLHVTRDPSLIQRKKYTRLFIKRFRLCHQFQEWLKDHLLNVFKLLESYMMTVMHESS